MRVALVIPALDPEPRLLELVDGIVPAWDGPIVVVDDGSSEAAQPIFEQAAARGCVVLRHARNLGKGRALKTAFNECLVAYPDCIGAVTADADGQHCVEDILACARALREDPEKLIVGCRDFSAAGVPTHNMLGNRITCVAMRLLCGVKVSDTQTGLRGIPRRFMDDLLTAAGERFEFETDMLLETKRLDIQIREVPIRTIYIDQGRASKFHVVRDSLRIYLLLLKYALSSAFASILDLVLYALIFPLVEVLGGGVASITIATVIARVFSATANFAINRNLVFKSTSGVVPEAVRYIVLCVCVMFASAGLVTGICLATGAASLPVKIVVDVLLFFVNYTIQRVWVFPPQSDRQR